jgi:hypothetical protein
MSVMPFTFAVDFQPLVSPLPPAALLSHHQPGPRNQRCAAFFFEIRSGKLSVKVTPSTMLSFKGGRISYPTREMKAYGTNLRNSLWSLLCSACCCRRHPCLCRLLPITPDHDHAQKRPDDCRAQQCEDDGYPDGPDSRGEEIVKRMSGVDEGLPLAILRVSEDGTCMIMNGLESLSLKLTISRVQMV